ncbi:O-antigen ligase family protein [Fontimonas sp. SYSU GA230001]|uniref:O-antigen ligase family protein n=1 Tax=Fontimonas sp. SYSU GA230001 TaxID=3142450 RepID=UPI0032B5A5D9
MTLPPKPMRSWSDRALFAATLAFLFWLPLPWGSHRPWAADLLVAVSAGLLALRLALVAAGRAPVPHGLARQLALPLLWWVLWLAWIGFQLWPMDAAVVARWSPSSAQLYATAAELLDTPPQMRLSIAPSQTADAWLLSAGYCCLYVLIVLSCCGDRRRMGLVLGVVATAGLFQALYGSLMTLSGLEWGFFEAKQHYRRVATGTFVNRNHLAGYLELAGAAALGLILADLGSSGAQRSLRQRALALIALLFSTKMRARLALIVMAIALVLTRSRMGNVAFVSSLCLCAMLFILLRHRRYALRAFALFASIVAIDILVVSNWYGLDRVIQRLEQTDLSSDSRAVFLRHAPPAIDAYWTTGAGLGTFAVAFAPYRSAELDPYFDHAHNDYIEFLIETGTVGCGLLAIFVLAHALHALAILVRRRRRMAAAVAFAALMGMLAIAIHSTADFNLQIPANAATLLVLMALSAGCSSSSRKRRRAAEPAPPPGATTVAEMA